MGQTDGWESTSVDHVRVMTMQCRCISYLVAKRSLDEAEQDLVRLSGFFGFGLVHDAHHLINALREEGEALHFVDVVSVLVSLSPPAEFRQGSRINKSSDLRLDVQTNKTVQRLSVQNRRRNCTDFARLSSSI